MQEEQETLLEEIAALKTPLIEVQADLKKLRDSRYWVDVYKRQDTLKSSVLMGTISIVFAFLLDMVIHFHFG